MLRLPDPDEIYFILSTPRIVRYDAQGKQQSVLKKMSEMRLDCYQCQCLASINLRTRTHRQKKYDIFEKTEIYWIE